MVEKKCTLKTSKPETTVSKNLLPDRLPPSPHTLTMFWECSIFFPISFQHVNRKLKLKIALWIFIIKGIWKLVLRDIKLFHRLKTSNQVNRTMLEVNVCIIVVVWFNPKICIHKYWLSFVMHSAKIMLSSNQPKDYANATDGWHGICWLLLFSPMLCKSMIFMQRKLLQVKQFILLWMNRKCTYTLLMSSRSSCLSSSAVLPSKEKGSSKMPCFCSARCPLVLSARRTKVWTKLLLLLFIP